MTTRAKRTKKNAPSSAAKTEKKDASKMEIVSLEIQKIQPDPLQPRKTFDDQLLAELAKSIKVHGLLQPITVRQVDDDYVIVMGERRYRACKLAGLKNIPCMVKAYSKQEVMEVQIIENLQRQDVEPTEEAEAIAYLNEKYEAAEIAQRLGRSDHFIRQRLKLAGLIEGFKQFIRSGKMSLKQGVRVGLFEPQEQAMMLETMGVEFSAHLIDRLIQEQSFDLERAPFSIEDDTIVTKAGACVICPFNAVNQGHLFGAGKMICTKSVCYTTKKQQVFKSLIEKAKKENILLIPEVRKYWANEENNQLILSTLEKHGLKVYLLDDLELIEKPEAPTLESLKEQYRYYNYTDENLQDKLESAQKDYEEECKAYSLTSENGFVKGILFNPETYCYKDCYVSILETASKPSDSHVIPVSERKMADCTPKEQIQKIKEREIRKQQIENNKQFEEVVDMIRETDYINTKKTLSEDEMIAFTISLYENNVGYTSQQKYFSGMFGKKSNMSKVKLAEQFKKNFKKEMFHKLIRLILTQQVHFGESNHTNNLTNISFYNAMRSYHKNAMEKIEARYLEEREKREQRLKERISTLEKKVKILSA
ncbi:ParB/RepB/Spo0J family partition protein [Tamlana fucoidanivorans]|uniref:ParB/RepB/Spo0J family partition protein n=1 Tax=Allotamlana fucoidanivorans TaxID=2583814 RepID=A0A5C4SRB3_9FLAO|nr:ParB/RepB/Spo0J family partition protein [Tamlana fucoidanivorans]TNJ46099.1 ParB/RepB/Spo0J family partition protein [Tamlana fucoidanivorans]